MKKNKSSKSSTQETVNVTISGGVTSETELPKLDLKQGQPIVIQLDHVGSINSGGIQNWILWVRTIQKEFKDSPMIFKLLPPAFVRHAKQINEFLPKNAAIDSFKIPYFCEECNKTTVVTFKKGENWDESWDPAEIVRNIEEVNCSFCGAVAEIDAIAEDYVAMQTPSDPKSKAG